LHTPPPTPPDAAREPLAHGRARAQWSVTLLALAGLALLANVARAASPSGVAALSLWAGAALLLLALPLAWAAGRQRRRNTMPLGPAPDDAPRAPARRQRQPLDSAVAERTRELAAAHEALRQSALAERQQAEAERMRLQAQLQATRDEAEAANRAKSAFLANMNHEIRTPLNAVIGLTHLMALDATEPRQRDRLAKIDAAAQQLLRVLHDILDLSRIEAGKLTLQERDISVQAVIRQTADLLDASAQRKGLALRVDIGTLPTLLRGDAARISQLLVNLLSNAIKFTDEGWVRVQACVTQSQAQRVQVRLDVQDTGMGIAPERQADLFSSFQQGDASTTRRHGGTGLGLALVRQLAQAMGGEVGCTSSVGQGSTFWVRIWLARAPQAVASPQPCRHDRRSAGRGRLDDALGRLRLSHRGRRVLLVDDNPVHQEVAKDLLTLAGLRVVLAGDGQTALDLAAAGAIDLVLLDLALPGAGGLATARALRRQGMTVPIIAMTGLGTSEDRQASLDAGMTDHIGKPLQPAALYESVLGGLH
jgi:two-component system sensor histidine kinase/response regulator